MKRFLPPTPLFTVRVLLALHLLFGADILAWTHPTSRPLGEWVLAGLTNYGLACLLLDLIARYRVRDLFGVMTLAGITALATGLLLHPAYSFADLPRTFITRTMGAHALLHLEMIGLFLWLTGTVSWSRWLLPTTVLVGFAWGVYSHYWPLQDGAAVGDWSSVLLYGLAMLATITVWRLWSSASVPASSDESPLLSRQAWGTLMLWGAGLFTLRWLQGVLDWGGVLIIALVLALCVLIIWFRGRKKGETLLDGHLPAQLPPLKAWLTFGAVFLISTAVGYQVPDVTLLGITPVTFIGLGFTAYGLFWLPTVALVLGVQAYIRQITQRLL